MKSRLPYPDVRAGGLILIATLAILTALPTLHAVILSGTEETLRIKKAYLAHLGLEILRLHEFLLYGNWSSKELIRLVGYGFVHVDLRHLMFNLVQLLPLWWLTTRRLGGVGMTLVYIAGVIISGSLHLASASPLVTTIGASGGVHFLGGLWSVWAFLDRRGSWVRRFWPACGVILFFAAQNLFLLSTFGTEFAWDLHLWGFLAGMALAAFVPQRRA